MPTTADRLVEAIGALATREARADPSLRATPDALATRCGTALVRSLAHDADSTGHRQLADVPSHDIEAALAEVTGCLVDATVSNRDIVIPVSRTRRRHAGAFYTPDALVRITLDCALDPWLDEHRDVLPHVLDPACGTGRFLLEAGRRLVAQLRKRDSVSTASAWSIVGPRLHGRDTDPLAIAWLRARIESLAGGDGAAASGIARGDALDDATFEERAFDVVLGNPPFGTALRSGSRVEHDRRRVKNRFPHVVEPYTDRAALFLLLACSVVRRAGRIGMVLPLSTLAARDARGVRAHVAQETTISAAWSSRSSVFDAQVHTCMLALHRTNQRTSACQRLVDLPARQANACEQPSSHETWATLAAPAIGLPDLPAFESSSSIADVAHATADFRDQYYGLRDALSEFDDAPDGTPVVTVGLIDPAQCHWSHRPCRIHGRTWRAPVVRRESLDETMQHWAESRLVPKILLPTQTRMLEPCLDQDGRLVPSVPLITVTCAHADDLHRVAAVLASPLITLIAKHRHLGLARTPDAIKLAARDVLDLPMPPASDSLDEAAAAFLQAQRADDRHDRQTWLDHCAKLTSRAFGIDDSLLQNWFTRLRPRRGRCPR